MRNFQYLEPETIDEAVILLGRHEGKVKLMAGGTDLLVRMKQGIASPQFIVNLKAVSNLDYVREGKDGGLEIGALTTLRTIEGSTLVREKADLLRQAARRVGAARIRNIGTIGGNVCQDSKCLYHVRSHLWGRTSSPCYLDGGAACYAVEGAKRCVAMSPVETGPALIALDAQAKIVGPKGTRTVPFEDFFVSSGVTCLTADEALAEIRIPPLSPSTSSVYLKFSLRETIDFAIAGVALLLTLDLRGRVCRDVKLALGAVGPTPLRARRAEGMLRGQVVDGQVIQRAAEVASKEAHPIGDVYGSAAYKRRIVQVLVSRAIRQELANAADAA